jgi:hypothetical protein
MNFSRGRFEETVEMLDQELVFPDPVSHDHHIPQEHFQKPLLQCGSLREVPVVDMGRAFNLYDRLRMDSSLSR